jgi:hypothetical protein
VIFNTAPALCRRALRLSAKSFVIILASWTLFICLRVLLLLIVVVCVIEADINNGENVKDLFCEKAVLFSSGLNQQHNYNDRDE